jgi:hypothetical protein
MISRLPLPQTCIKRSAIFLFSGTDIFFLLNCTLSGYKTYKRQVKR